MIANGGFAGLSLPVRVVEPTCLHFELFILECVLRFRLMRQSV